MDKSAKRKKTRQKKKEKAKLKIFKEDGWFWDYSEENGPNLWSERFPDARGHHQSPVDIGPKDLTRLIIKEPLKLNGCENFHKCDNCEITNTGLTGENVPEFRSRVKFPGKCKQEVSVDGGLLPAEYTLRDVLFHWGSGEARGGTEHTFASKSYGGEAHFFFYKKGCKTWNDALAKSDGFLVIAIFLEVIPVESRTYHAGFDLFLSELKGIQKYKSTTNVPAWYLVEVLKDSVTPYGWYTYHGSLTFPPCTENVTWILIPEPVLTNPRNFAIFAHLENEHHHKIVNNRRPVQQLNNRPVFKGMPPQQPPQQ